MVLPAEPETLLPALERALEGTGPAVAPIGRGPERERVLTAIAPDRPLETGLGRSERSDDSAGGPGRGGSPIAAVLPTSGSTGTPKGVQLSARALTASAEATHARLGGPGRWLLALPVDRIAGLQVLVRSLRSGTVPVTMPPTMSGRFTVEEFEAATHRLGSGPAGIRRYTALVPTQLHRLLDAGPSAIDALRTYTAILIGGAAAASSLLERARTAGVPVVTTYGMTETCGGCVYDGTPLDGVRIEIDAAAGDDAGRIRIAGPVLFSGYRLDPDATAAALVDGWHPTADLGRIDPDGRLNVLGRVDDVVISGGVNVPLPAVEDALQAIPGIAQVAVVGVPDEVWGTRVVAHIVPEPGTEPPTLPQVRDHITATARHPKAYAPRRLIVTDALPLLPSGKIDRAALRAAG